VRAPDLAPVTVRFCTILPTSETIMRAPNQELLRHLRTAIKRVEIANAEGDPILSAWLPEAIAAVDAATDTPVEGEIYRLTGGPSDACIANGDTWEDSHVDCCNCPKCGDDWRNCVCKGGAS
jgi:hypothetical protein